jgi:sugar/nucleoside kinase (ribokinase family)
MSVLIAGVIGIDDIFTPTSEAKNVLGGPVSYSALAASFFGPVNTVSAVGTDFPADFSELFEKRKINLEGVQVIEGKTFRWGGRYEVDGNKRTTLFTELHVFENYQGPVPKNYHGSRYILLCNAAPELQMRVLDQIHKPDFVIADTMNFWIFGARDALMEMLKRIDLLVLNDTESMELSGENNVFKAARWILARGPRFVAIKKGEHGCLLTDGKQTFVAPAVPLDHVVDPTGAGDTFAGGMIGHLGATHDTSFDGLRKAVIEGTILASFSVEDFSVHRLQRLDEKEREHRRQLLREITRF